MTNQIPYYSEDDLAGLDIKAQEVVDILEQLIRGNENNTVMSAPKAVILPPDGRYIMATLACMDEPPLVATKSLVLNARNTDIGLPQINGLVTLLHGETGVPVAVIDGNWVTAIRTAALSATAAKYLAKPTSSSMGFIGCGVQAQSHLKLFADMFPLEKIRVFGRGQKNIDTLCASADELGLQSGVCETAQQAVESVDLLVTSVTHTDVSGPFLKADWLGAGSFAAIVDLAVPWHKDSFSRLDRLIIDDLEQEASLPNKLADPADVHGDLSALVMQKVAGRVNQDERTAFVFRGHALGDLALSALAYRKFQATD